VRGDVYCLGDGNYGNSVNFNVALSGTSTIEIRKAQSYDANCAGLTGWNTSTMGSAQAYWQSTGSGQIVPSMTGYYIFNGNSSESAGTIGCGGVYASPPASMTSPAPTPSNCGIKIDDSTCTSTATDGCDGGSGVMKGGGAGIVWEWVEWFGQGLNSNGNNNSETYFWFANGGTLTSLAIQHCYCHNAGTTYLTVVSGGWNGGTFDHNYVWGVFDGITNHGEAIQLQGNNTTMAVHHNIFRDQQTNGDVVGVSTGVQTGLAFYDNVDFCSPGGTSTTCRHNDGVLGCFQAGNNCTAPGWLEYGNTFNFPSNCGWTINDGSTSTLAAKNNLWFGCGSVTMTGSVVATVDYNSYLNSSKSAVGAHDVSNSSAPNPFASSTNFNISYENALWDNRVSLGSPYDTDFNGAAFTSDRGAYQYTGMAPTVKPIITGQNGRSGSVIK
jgi:hypothetical protein